MNTNLFLHIEQAAHTAALGQNRTPSPTPAQCLAGNYKVGRVRVFGLPISIENPRGSYRFGTDKNGKKWRTLMPAHYGYITGTQGNDGDCVDCFIGPITDSDMVFVVNQVINGQFDEHKVMLFFSSEAMAKAAYLNSYERDWKGFSSMVSLSVEQLKWWLKNGEMDQPINHENLPQKGVGLMMKKVYWDKSGVPANGVSIDKVLYEIRRDDGSDELLLDSVSVHDILEDADGSLVFDALVTPYAKLERKMEVLRGVMDKASANLNALAVQISTPFKQRGVTNVAAIFELSDGQTISVFFHNPDVNPNKLGSNDELISWKWLLNKKDITIVVAPEKGVDLNIKDVSLRIMKLAEKNSAAFKRANAKRSERMQNIQNLKDEISGLEKELSQAQSRLEAAKIETEDRKKKAETKSADKGVTTETNTQTTDRQSNELQMTAADRKFLDDSIEGKIKTIDITPANTATNPEPIVSSEEGNVPPEAEQNALKDAKELIKGAEFKALQRDIINSLASIRSIDNGDMRGFDRASFVNSIVTGLKFTSQPAMRCQLS